MEIVVGHSTPILKRKLFDQIIHAAEHWNNTRDSSKPKVSIKFVSLEDEQGKPLKNLPRLDAVLHKRTDDMAAVLTNCNSDSTAHMEHLKRVYANVNVVPIDPLKNVWNLLDRKSTSSLVNSLSSHGDRSLRSLVRPLQWCIVSTRDPDEVISKRLAENNTKFPIILKRRLACGFPETHNMGIAWNLKGAIRAIRTGFVADLGSSSSTRDTTDAERLGRENIGCELFVQEFVANHAGVVFKGYGIGKHCSIQPKLSLLHDVEDDGSGCFLFHSHRIYKQRQLDPAVTESILTRADLVKPSDGVVDAVISNLSQSLGITMIGVDFLYEEQSRKYFLVDVNYFPSFGGVPLALEKILDNIVHVVSKRFA